MTHFADAKIDIQRSLVICPSFHSLLRDCQDWNSGFLALESITQGYHSINNSCLNSVRVTETTTENSTQIWGHSGETHRRAIETHK